MKKILCFATTLLFAPGGNCLTGEYRQGKWIGKPSLGKKNAQKLRTVYK